MGTDEIDFYDSTDDVLMKIGHTLKKKPPPVGIDFKKQNGLGVNYPSADFVSRKRTFTV